MIKKYRTFKDDSSPLSDLYRKLSDYERENILLNFRALDPDDTSSKQDLFEQEQNVDLLQKSNEIEFVRFLKNKFLVLGIQERREAIEAVLARVGGLLQVLPSVMLDIQVEDLGTNDATLDTSSHESVDTLASMRQDYINLARETQFGIFFKACSIMPFGDELLEIHNFLVSSHAPQDDLHEVYRDDISEDHLSNLIQFLLLDFKILLEEVLIGTSNTADDWLQNKCPEVAERMKSVVSEGYAEKTESGCYDWFLSEKSLVRFFSWYNYNQWSRIANYFSLNGKPLSPSSLKQTKQNIKNEEQTDDFREFRKKILQK